MPGDLTYPLFLLTPPLILSFTLSPCFWMHIPSGLWINVNDGNSCLSLIKMVTEPWKMLTAPFFLSEIESPEYWLVLECLTRVYLGFCSVGYELNWYVQFWVSSFHLPVPAIRLGHGCGISEPVSTVRSVMLWERQVTETAGTWRALEKNCPPSGCLLQQLDLIFSTMCRGLHPSYPRILEALESP